MTGQGNSEPSDDENLETTAELPMLDIAAYEAARAELVSGDTLRLAVPLRAPDVVPEPSSPEPGAPEASVSHVEEDFRALSLSLKDLEDRLATKGERLSALEAELQRERTAHLALAHRAEARAAELVAAQEALERANARGAELEQHLRERTEESAASRDRSGALAAGLAERDQALERAGRELARLKRQLDSHQETLRSHEGRRGVFDLMLREVESVVAERDRRIRQLESELNEGASRSKDFEARLAASGERASVLQAQVGSLRSSLESRAAELAALTRANQELEEAARATAAAAAGQAEERQVLHEAAAKAAAAQARAEADSLESQRRAEAAVERVRALEQDLRTGEERDALSEEHLRAAHETIHRLELQLHMQSLQRDETARADVELRAALEAASEQLAERDALIHRLEAEAIRSTALLDNIRHSIGLAGPPSVEQVGLEAATRLLIRADGDVEVVHVLGRKTSIGRTPDNDVQIDTKFISRHHAVILASPTQTIIEDLNSTNGVLVNGRRVMRELLKDGDTVIVGKTPFRFAVRPIERRVLS